MLASAGQVKKTVKIIHSSRSELLQRPPGRALRPIPQAASPDTAGGIQQQTQPLVLHTTSPSDRAYKNVGTPRAYHNQSVFQSRPSPDHKPPLRYAVQDLLYSTDPAEENCPTVYQRLPTAPPTRQHGARPYRSYKSGIYPAALFQNRLLIIRLESMTYVFEV